MGKTKISGPAVFMYSAIAFTVILTAVCFYHYSLFGVLFSLIWGLFPVFLTVSILAILFDAQFIVVQRYNRPIVLRLKERREAKQTV